MASNSSIFSSTIFGNGSALTAQQAADKITTTQEQVLAQSTNNTIRTKLPKVPSNQGKAKD